MMRRCGASSPGSFLPVETKTNELAEDVKSKVQTVTKDVQSEASDLKRRTENAVEGAKKALRRKSKPTWSKTHLKLVKVVANVMLGDSCSKSCSMISIIHVARYIGPISYEAYSSD